MVMSSWPTIVWCVDRKELFLYLTSQLLQDRHAWTFRPGLQEKDVCTLLLTKSILGLPNWICAGYKRVGDVRPACLFPLVKLKCFLDSGVRRCCKAGHSCMRSVIDCSSVPHKMAWRSVARAIRTVARLGGPGCEIFDISQLRYELDSMFQGGCRNSTVVSRRYVSQFPHADGWWESLTSNTSHRRVVSRVKGLE